MNIIPLGPQDIARIKTWARIQRPRVERWTDPRASATGDRNIREERGTYSRRCIWRKIDYTPCMESVAKIADDGALEASIDGNRYVLMPRRGYVWGVDKLGIKLIRNRDGADHHPDSDDIRVGYKAIIGKLAAQADVRKNLKRIARRDDAIIKAASKHGVWVSLVDARTAGNCATGVSAFCAQHGLDPARHYRAATLPVDDNRHRLALAITAAKRRQVSEMSSGVCSL